MSFQMDRRREGAHSVRMVYCLAMDLIASTETGLRLVTAKLDSFNMSLVEQIGPHLENLELSDAVIKFTGDGWLVMTDNADNVPALCCLATIMVHRFRDEMSRKTGLSTDSIPSLRLTICAGRDLRVRLPDGHKDWVGDSARRAVRAAGYCVPNEILIDETVRYLVFRDFDVQPVDLQARSKSQQPKKAEEVFTLYHLGELHSELAAESEAPGYFVYTLEAIGKIEAAALVARRGSERMIHEANRMTSPMDIIQRRLRNWNRLISNLGDYSTARQIIRSGSVAGLSPNVATYNAMISKSPDYDGAKSWVNTMREQGVLPNIATFNALITKSPDYKTAISWLDVMHRNGIIPDVTTYNVLIDRSPDYDTAKSWLNTMQQSGIHPDVGTFNSLIASSVDYEEAKSWFDTMHDQDVQPDIVTYNTLISKAPDYDAAQTLIDAMRNEVVQPDSTTYSALFSKDLSGHSADEILSWYSSQSQHPDGPIQSAIAAFLNGQRIDQALRLALEYPHLDMARRIVREYQDEALAYFEEIPEKDPRYGDALYALGVTLMELGREIEAQGYLKKAWRFATQGSRRSAIEDKLRQITEYTENGES
ncbi:MAG: hypothetical protein SVY53_05685 [Chloroflexota bacterium]|nr:hypothetical protein [Chloroflexota bacterium]